MTIRHLKIFITVAECGKMNTAAKQLYVSQPSVSQAIAELENYYDIRLFERLSQRLYITEEGNRLLSYARHIVDSFEGMDEMMQKIGEHPKLRIGASVSVGTCLLNGWLEMFQISQGNTDTSVVVNNTTVIEQMILDSRLDIGVVEGIVNSKELLQVPVCRDELVVVVGKKNPFYKQKAIFLKQLEGMGYIAREDGSQVRNQFELLLIEKGIFLNQKWSCTNTEAIKNAVVSSKHAAIMSYMLVEKEIKEGSLKVLPIQDVQVIREIKMIYHKNKYISKSIQAFMDCIKRCPQLTRAGSNV